VSQPRITQRSAQTIRWLSIEAIGDASTSISIAQMSGSRQCAVRPQCRCGGRNAIVNLWVGITSFAATVSRVMLVIWLVFFSVYDALAGAGTGVLIIQAAGTAGDERAHFGAAAELVWDSRWTGTMSSWGVVGDSCLAGRRQHGCDRAAPSRRTLASDSGCGGLGADRRARRSPRHGRIPRTCRRRLASAADTRPPASACDRAMSASPHGARRRR
jgi:hypothetical protein